MRTSKLARSALKYLPLLIAMVGVVLGILLAKDMHQASLDTRTPLTAQLPSKNNDPQLWIVPETAGTCFSQLIYTSLPPKCRTADGTFIQAPGTSSNIFVIPQK